MTCDIILDIVGTPDFAPIAFFIFNRLDHTRRTLEALKLNPEAKKSDLIVFSDGPRNVQDLPAIEALRAYISSVDGFKSIRIIKREKNWGLAESIIQGVTEILSEFETVIVLEDDLVSAPFFLKYMNEALKKYSETNNVSSILGYSFPTGVVLPETYFLKGADCWGWATWRRAWALFEPDGQKLLDEIYRRGLAFEFNLEGSTPYTKMLQDQIDGKNNSWAIRWRASVFLAGGLSLYTGRSLIRNIGMDGTGTHCSETNMFETSLANSPISVKDIELQLKREALDGMVRYYRKHKPGILRTFASLVKRKIISLKR